MNAHRIARIAVPAVLALLTASAAHAHRGPSHSHQSMARQAVGDGGCAPDERLLSAYEARRDLRRVCRSLDRWAIARLAGGASMDGPGYGCKVRDYDRRRLGHSVCVDAPRATRPAVYRPSQPAPVPDTYRPDPRPNTYLPMPRTNTRRGERVRRGERIALRSVHGTFLSAPPGGALRADSRRLGKRQIFTLRSDKKRVRDGSIIALQSHRGHFVVAEGDGRANANRGLRGAWEDWMIETADGSRKITCGEQVHLRSHHDRYLVAEPGGQANANRREARSWETFTLVCLDR